MALEVEPDAELKRVVDDVQQRIASSLNSLADLDLDQGDLASAQALYREALAIGRELGERLRIAFSLEGLAAVFDLLGRAPRAARIVSASSYTRPAISGMRSVKNSCGLTRQSIACASVMCVIATRAALPIGQSSPLGAAASIRFQ